MEKNEALQRTLRVIRRAIDSRAVISFYYMGEKKVVEPFTLGIHATTGAHVLKSYKSELFQLKDAAANWELLEVEKMERISATPVRAKSIRLGYDVPDANISEIIITVDKPAKKLISFFL